MKTQESQQRGRSATILNARRALWKTSIASILAAALCGANERALAAPVSWVGGNNTSWFDSPNWAPTVPTFADDATVANGNTALIEGVTAAEAGNLFINGNSGVTIGSISPGTLTVDGEISLGISGTGRLNLNAGTVSLNTLTVGPSGIYTDTAAGTLNLTGADPTIRMAIGVNVVVNSQVTGTDGLIKEGLGTLTLANDNTYTGPTTISLGTLQIGNGGGSGSLGSGNVTNNATLVFNRNNELVVDNVITGTGSLRQAGTGTTILTGDNDYTGGTSIGSGTLQIGNDGTTGSLGSGNVTNNGTLAFKRSDEIVVDNTISGTGNLRQTGSGTTILTANNTYSGTTTITNGTLQVGNGGTTGSMGTGNVVNDSTLVFNRSDDITVGNQVSGTGDLVHAGDGQLTLTGNNTYSGTTTITNGALQVGNGGNSGSLGTGTVINDSTLIFNRSDSITVNNLITGTGDMVHAGTNTLTLTGNNTYSGTTTISNGTLQVGNGGTSGSLGSGDVINDGTLTLNRSDNTVVSNSISGSGNLNKAGAGTATLTGDNTYSGPTTISAGTLQVGNGGTDGSLGSGSVTNNARLVFNQSDNNVISNTISGTGSLVQGGSGTVILTSNNSYTGTTTITNGTLQVGDGGTAGSLGTGNVTNNAALVYNRSDEVVVSNTISGTGTFTQMGNGTVVLAVNNSYSGFTTISNGTLQIGNGGTTGTVGTNEILNFGSLVINRSDNLFFNNRISGTGMVTHGGTNIIVLVTSNSYSGGTSITNGGTLAVSNAFALGSGDMNVLNGTLTTAGKVLFSVTNKFVINIGGNYSQGTNGTLELTIAGTESNKYDQVEIAGTATLDGTLKLQGSGTNYIPHHNETLKLLTATGGVSGVFSTFTGEIPHSALLDPGLIYNPNDVWLTWTQLSFVNFLVTSNGVQLTPNQLAVAQNLDALANSTFSNDVALIDFLDYLPNLTNSLPPAFDQIAPEELTATMVASFAVMDAQGQQFLKRAGEVRADYRRLYTTTLRPRARSPKSFDEFVDKPWSAYVELPANFTSVDSDNNADGYNVSVFGVSFGADRRFSDELTAGAAIGYANGSADLSGGGSLDMDSFNAQLYAIWHRNSVHVEGMVGGAFNSFETKRESIGGTADGSTDGFAWTALLGGGYDWENGNWKFGPAAAVQYTSASINSFTESGSLSPMSIESQTEDAMHVQGGLSVRYRHQLFDSWTIISPEVFLGWRHDFMGNDLSLDTQFANGGGSTFTVKGPELGSDSVVVSLGVGVQWKPSFNTFFSFTTLLGRDGYDSKNLNAGARLSF